MSIPWPFLWYVSTYIHLFPSTESRPHSYQNWTPIKFQKPTHHVVNQSMARDEETSNNSTPPSNHIEDNDKLTSASAGTAASKTQDSLKLCGNKLLSLFTFPLEGWDKGFHKKEIHVLVKSYIHVSSDSITGTS